MRRRFGRQCPREEGRFSSQDAERLLEILSAAQVLPVKKWELLSPTESLAGLAALGRGQTAEGKVIVTAVAPRLGGDALMAAVATAGLLAEQGQAPQETVAVAPTWNAAARRRLGALKKNSLPLRVLVLPQLAPDTAGVEPESATEPPVYSVEEVGGHLERPLLREFFLQAASGLAGLAAKYSGVVRGRGRSVELALLARRVAVLHAAPEGIALELLFPKRVDIALTPEAISEALERLEGCIRKYLSEKNIRNGEEGLRGRVIPLLIQAADLRAAKRWPIGGADLDSIDLVGIGRDGRPLVAAVRGRLSLAALGSILDAFLELRPFLTQILPATLPPLRLDAPRCVLAAEQFEPEAARVLSQLALDFWLFDVLRGSGREGEVAVREHERSATPVPVQPVAPREEPPQRPPRSENRYPERSERNGRGERAEEAGGESRPRRPQRFEELSAFDLEEDQSRESRGGGGARRRRGRRRSRGRRDSSGDLREGRAEESGPEAEPLAELSLEESVDTAAEPKAVSPAFASGAIESLETEMLEGEAPEEEELSLAEQLQRERERRRRARLAKVEPEPEEEPQDTRPPRRRSVFLAHADRDSIAAALLIARDLRMVEGFWVYPQAELMTFFRSVATDLREETPIYVVGFTASPARETIQAASLYRERLLWIDHHAWPPEDVDGMRRAIGEDALQLMPGAGSSLPAAVALCARRSRFSDKFLDLVTGRFSEHDFERWGHRWWAQLGEMAVQAGDVRASLEPLLVGRPSELAEAAARGPVPPPPVELTYVAERDFRLVHFGGYRMVVVPVPEFLSLYLAGRIARERYAAQLSLACIEGGELLVLAGDDDNARRSLHCQGMIQHLAGKFAWAEVGPDDDHVARLRVHGLALHPERLDEVIAEIAMGRSLFEG